MWLTGAWFSYAPSFVAWPEDGSKWRSSRRASWTSLGRTLRPCRGPLRARTGVKLGASAAANGVEARALFLTWEELGPLLDYVPEDGECQAVVAMCDLLRELYTDKTPRGDLLPAEVARAYRAHCCKEACQSNYLLDL